MYRSSRLISRIRRISDQNTVQKSTVSAGDSAMPNSKQTILPINSQSDNYVRRKQVSDAIKLSGFQFWSAKDDLKLQEQVRLQNYILAIPRDRILLR
jgi:hypothetical protein